MLWYNNGVKLQCCRDVQTVQMATMKPHYLLCLYRVVIVKTIKLEEVDKPRLIYCGLVQVRILLRLFVDCQNEEDAKSRTVPISIYCHRSCTAASLTITGTREHFGYAKQDLHHTAVPELSPRPVLVTRDHVRTPLLTWKQDTTTQHSGPCSCIIDAAATRECFQGS